ncbi:MAG: PEP/pyruvate-binding domain-containing protein, partial [Dehalococcoidia bacterium]
MTESRKYIYRFSEGNAQMRNLLGGKGANLSEMVGLGLPVPPGFIITTDVSLEYYKIGKKMPDGLWEDIQAHMHELEANVGRKLGDANNPLLVSVRSGSRFSMPGMMDTILNLGVNDQVVEGLARQMNDRRPAFDAYRRFLQIFGDVAMEVPSSVFEEILEECKRKAGVQLDHELSVDQLVPLVDDFKKVILQHVGGEVP